MAIAFPTSTTRSPISFSSSLSSSPIPTVRLLPRRSPARVPAVRSKIREIFMPALSSTMTEGKIVSWIKSEGDRLAKGEPVVVVESDKADMDVETFYDGFLAAIVVPQGAVAPVGSPIALLAESEDELPEARAKAHASAASAPPPPSPVPSVRVQLILLNQFAHCLIPCRIIAQHLVHKLCSFIMWRRMISCRNRCALHSCVLCVALQYMCKFICLTRRIKPILQMSNSQTM